MLGSPQRRRRDLHDRATRHLAAGARGGRHRDQRCNGADLCHPAQTGGVLQQIAFVRDGHRRPESQRIVKAIIAIAESFDLEVIAEGVESEEELSVVRSLGCNRVQGYLVARPLRPEKVFGFVEGYDRTLSFSPES